MTTLNYPAGTYQGFDRFVRFQCWTVAPNWWDVTYLVKPGLRFTCVVKEINGHKDVVLVSDKDVELIVLTNKFSGVAAWIIQYCNEVE